MDNNKDLSFDEVHRFFVNIFQSKKLCNNPTLPGDLDMNNYVCNFITDKEITINEVEDACANMGTGTSLDGIPPDISKLLPPELKIVITNLFTKVFDDSYPKDWQNQLLFSIAKKDHSIKNPKLRGIAIGPFLSRLYDHIINERFCKWYKPNSEQAGYRKGQGCVLQLFSLFLLIDHAKNSHKDLFIGLLDFEKAFDYTNRYLLVESLMEHNIGKKFARALTSMYHKNEYTPKLTGDYIGEPIESKYGVTQGRKSSANLFSFFISDMSEFLCDPIMNDFMDPFCLLQLADDTSVLAECIVSLKTKLSRLLQYAKKKYQHPHITKTRFMHMSNTPIMEPITLEDGQHINTVKVEDGYTFLDFNLSYSNDIYKIIQNNLNRTMGNIVKFYAWLEDNEDTPFDIKLKVLYTCLFSSMLYSVEAWGDTSKYETKLMKIEQEALKHCLQAKNGTTNDIIYIELNKSDIISTIKDRQYNFSKKIENLDSSEAIVKSIWEMCENNSTSNMKHHYSNVRSDNKKVNLAERKQKVQNSTSTMCIHYREVIGIKFSDILYKSTLKDSKRKIITRWRLSCHQLKIETGRYTRPKTPRKDRKCIICQIIEDEYHALFACKAHIFIRRRYLDLLQQNDSVMKLLNPSTINLAENVANYITEVEANMKSLHMV